MKNNSLNLLHIKLIYVPLKYRKQRSYRINKKQNMPPLNKLKIGDWVNVVESDQSYINYGTIYAAQIISISKNNCIIDISTAKEKIHKKISKSKIVHIFNL